MGFPKLLFLKGSIISVVGTTLEVNPVNERADRGLPQTIKFTQLMPKVDIVLDAFMPLKHLPQWTAVLNSRA